MKFTRPSRSIRLHTNSLLHDFSRSGVYSPLFLTFLPALSFSHFLLFSHIWWSLLCVLSVRWEQQREEATSEWLKQRKKAQQMGRRLLQILELFLTLPRCLHSQTHRDCKLILKGIVWITQRPVWDSGSKTLSKSITISQFSRYNDYSSKMHYFEWSG